MAEEVQEAVAEGPAVEEKAQQPKKGGGMFDSAKGGNPGEVDLDSLVSEMKSEPKQHYVDPEMVGANASGAEGEEAAGDASDHDGGGDDPFVGNVELTEEQYRNNAKWIIEITDTMMAYTLSTIALEEDSEYYKAKAKEKDQMVTALAQGLKETQSTFNIPWWAVLLVAAFMAYGPKAGEAFRKRSEKTRQNQAMNWQQAHRPPERDPEPAPPPRPPQPEPEKKTMNVVKDEDPDPENKQEEGKSMQTVEVPLKFEPVERPKSKQQDADDDDQQDDEDPSSEVKPRKGPYRVCEYPSCTKLLTDTQKHYCSRSHNNKHRAMKGTNQPQDKREDNE